MHRMQRRRNFFDDGQGQFTDNPCITVADILLHVAFSFITTSFFKTYITTQYNTIIIHKDIGKAMNKVWAIVALLATQGCAFHHSACVINYGKVPRATYPLANRAFNEARVSRTSVLRHSTDGYLKPAEVPGFMSNPTLADELAGLESPYGLSEDPRDTVLRATKKKETLTRIILPTAVAFILSTILYPYLSLLIKGVLDAGELSIIGNDSSQFIQNFVTVRHPILLYSKNKILCD